MLYCMTYFLKGSWLVRIDRLYWRRSLLSELGLSLRKMIITINVYTHVAMIIIASLCIVLKVPLTPKFFLSRQKSPFCSDHIGEKIIVVGFFLDFLWIFKIRKIRATVVHRRVSRRMGRVGLWRQPGKPFRLERRDIRGQRGIAQLQRKKITTMSYRCVAANIRNVVDLAKCILVHNIPFFGD